jgi:CVNH domain-containing protein
MSSTKPTSASGFIAGSVMMLSLAAIPASAQGLPNGSYMQTCRNVAVHGDRLLADCRRTDGSWARTALRDVDRCVGDIGNMNGQLACNHTGGNNRFSREGDNRGWPESRYGYENRGYRPDWDGRYGPENRDYRPAWNGSSDDWRNRADWPRGGYQSDYGR